MFWVLLAVSSAIFENGPICFYRIWTRLIYTISSHSKNGVNWFLHICFLYYLNNVGNVYWSVCWQLATVTICTKIMLVSKVTNWYQTRFMRKSEILIIKYIYLVQEDFIERCIFFFFFLPFLYQFLYPILDHSWKWLEIQINVFKHQIFSANFYVYAI